MICFLVTGVTEWNIPGKSFFLSSLLLDEVQALPLVYTFCADSTFPRPKGNKSSCDLLTIQKSVNVNYPTKTLSVHFTLEIFRTRLRSPYFEVSRLVRFVCYCVLSASNGDRQSKHVLIDGHLVSSLSVGLWLPDGGIWLHPDLSNCSLLSAAAVGFLEI